MGDCLPQRRERVDRKLNMEIKYSQLMSISPPFLSSLRQEHAFESSQKYKEGKYIIELAHMIKENGWE